MGAESGEWGEKAIERAGKQDRKFDKKIVDKFVDFVEILNLLETAEKVFNHRGH